jgi:hypothetical protein
MYEVELDCQAKNSIPFRSKIGRACPASHQRPRQPGSRPVWRNSAALAVLRDTNFEAHFALCSTPLCSYNDNRWKLQSSVEDAMPLWPLRRDTGGYQQCERAAGRFVTVGERLQHYKHPLQVAGRTRAATPTGHWHDQGHGERLRVVVPWLIALAQFAYEQITMKKGTVRDHPGLNYIAKHYNGVS